MNNPINIHNNKPQTRFQDQVQKRRGYKWFLGKDDPRNITHPTCAHKKRGVQMFSEAKNVI